MHHAKLLGVALLAAYCAASHADPTPPSPGNADAGRLLYQQRCTVCHSADYNGVGPAHRGVYGRAAAQAPGFANYSKALKASGLVWTEDNLKRWLTNPEQLVPGQGMGISVPEEQARADLVAYLKTLTGPPPTATPAR
jgi:cytochrome c